MFSLRSSPSTLVCDLRDGWASSSTTAAVHLSAPRPHRPSVMFGFDVSYDSGGGSGAGLGGDGAGLSRSGAGSGSAAGGGCGGGGGARGAFSPAVSDYAGVFEAGFDPAQVRASMTNRVVEVATAQPARENRLDPGAASRRAGGGIGGRGWPGPSSEAYALEAGAFVDEGEEEEDEEGEEEEEDDVIGRNDQEDEEEEADFLFEMEGLKEPPLPTPFEEVREDDGRGRGGALAGGAASDRSRGEGGGMSSGGWGMAAAAAAAAAGVVAATAAAGSQRSSTSTCSSGGLPRAEVEQGSTAMSAIAAAGGVREGGGAGIACSGNNKNVALRKPRVIAPRGTRCLGGGMYRLRLSTSC